MVQQSFDVWPEITCQIRFLRGFIFSPIHSIGRVRTGGEQIRTRTRASELGASQAITHINVNIKFVLNLFSKYKHCK